MLSALAAGVRTFGDPYRAAGERLRDFILQRLWDGEKLYLAGRPWSDRLSSGQTQPYERPDRRSGENRGRERAVGKTALGFEPSRESVAPRFGTLDHR